LKSVAPEKTLPCPREIPIPCSHHRFLGGAKPVSEPFLFFMTPEIIPAYHVPLSEQAKVFTQAFAGYVGGAFAMDAAALAHFVSLQGADLCYSRFARTINGLVGFAYINRTGGISRLAGMGIVPAARRAGLARELVHRLIDEAAARHDQAIILEVIAQNVAGHALYRGSGFREVARLFGWRRGATKAIQKQASPLEEIPLISASHILSALEYPDLPWPISRHAIVKIAAGRAFRLGDAVIVISDPELPPIRMHALSCASETMNWSALRNALGTLLELYPGSEFFTPPVFPEQFGEEIYQPLGFTAEPISQLLMRYEVDGARRP
jgi:ribosomal protein S18 acetylase RimI-like enzyme